jgi:hypothetical protein
MHFHPTYLVSISILGATTAALCFAAALAIPPGSAGARSNSGLEPGISDTVNRASKGDRLRMIVRPPGAAPFEVQGPAPAPPKSLDGCESAFGPIDQSSAASLAQSCVT